MKRELVTYWKRKGFYYVSVSLWTDPADPTYDLKVTRKYDFFSYHLIRWYHGEAKMEELAEDQPRKFRENAVR